MSLKIILSVYSFVISIHFFYLILRKNLKPKEVDCRNSVVGYELILNILSLQGDKNLPGHDDFLSLPKIFYACTPALDFCKFEN